MELQRQQYKRPTGELGLKLASHMNQHHEALSLWGLSHVNIQPDYVVLDVGCGGGKMVNRLAQDVPQGKVFGIDYSKDMVNYSNNFNKNLVDENRVKILEESVQKMSFPNYFFDLVTAVETYYFWPSLTEGLREIRRVLKPNGKLLLISELTKDGSFEKKNVKWLKDTGARVFGLEEIQNEMKLAGYADVHVFKHKSVKTLILNRERQPWNTIIGVNPSSN
jgi:ubiquinone/menaquinone biosynthesis C-methylase UbiE